MTLRFTPRNLRRMMAELESARRDQRIRITVSIDDEPLYVGDLERLAIMVRLGGGRIEQYAWMGEVFHSPMLSVIMEDGRIGNGRQR